MITSQTKPMALDAGPPWRFDNRFVRALPADRETVNQPRQVTGVCYSRVHPAMVLLRTPSRVTGSSIGGAGYKSAFGVLLHSCRYVKGVVMKPGCSRK